MQHVTNVRKCQKLQTYINRKLLKCTMRTIVVIFAILLNIAWAVETFDKHQVWRIIPQTEDELDCLKRLNRDDEIDFWQSPHGINHVVDVRLSPSQKKQFAASLKLNGIKYNVMIEDVQELINSQTRNIRSSRDFTSISDFDYTVYHDLDDIEKWGDVLVDEYSFATKFQIGVSFEGLPLNVIEIRKPRAGNERKPIMYIDTLIHSREWVTAASFMFIFKEMLTNTDYAWMIDDYDWLYVPCMNVDGYTTTWDEDRLWRKTRSTGASSKCRGTDPNRNFDFHWSEPGASADPCSLTFYGPTPFSENDDLGQNMSAAIKSVHGKTYVAAQSASGIYVSSGGTKDWTHSVAGIDISYSYELRDTGQYGFLLPEDQIIPTGEEVLASIVVLAEYVHSIQ